MPDTRQGDERFWERLALRWATESQGVEMKTLFRRAAMTEEAGKQRREQPPQSKPVGMLRVSDTSQETKADQIDTCLVCGKEIPPGPDFCSNECELKAAPAPQSAEL